MKRDMDLARKILREIETTQCDGGPVEINITEYTEAELNYHYVLLTEAGLIISLDGSTLGGVAYYPIRLTWQGHEFLESAKNDSYWGKAKSIVVKTAGGLTFESLQYVLKELAKRAILNEINM